MKMKGQEKTERSKQHKAWRGRSQRWRPVRRHMIRRHDDVSWSHLTDCCSLKTQNKEPKAAVPLTSVSIHPLVKRITHRPCERWLVSHQSCFLSWPHEGNTQLEFSGDLSCVRVELRAASGLICVIKIIKINRCQVNSTRVKAWASNWKHKSLFPKINSGNRCQGESERGRREWAALFMCYSRVSAQPGRVCHLYKTDQWVSFLSHLLCESPSIRGRCAKVRPSFLAFTWNYIIPGKFCSVLVWKN